MFDKMFYAGKGYNAWQIMRKFSVKNMNKLLEKFVKKWQQTEVEVAVVVIVWTDRPSWNDWLLNPSQWSVLGSVASVCLSVCALEVLHVCVSVCVEAFVSLRLWVQCLAGRLSLRKHTASLHPTQVVCLLSLSLSVCLSVCSPSLWALHSGSASVRVHNLSFLTLEAICGLPQLKKTHKIYQKYFQKC